MPQAVHKIFFIINFLFPLIKTALVPKMKVVRFEI